MTSLKRILASHLHSFVAYSILHYHVTTKNMERSPLLEVRSHQVMRAQNTRKCMYATALKLARYSDDRGKCSLVIVFLRAVQTGGSVI